MINCSLWSIACFFKGLPFSEAAPFVLFLPVISVFPMLTQIVLVQKWLLDLPQRRV